MIARDRHAELLWACASIGATCELVAVELRHLQRTEVGEVLEGFKPGQKGSSAMPHKRNPISAETISGLARVRALEPARRAPGRRALARAGHLALVGRARSCCPTRRTLVHYSLRRLDRLLARLVVIAERMLDNLWSSHGLVFSQPVLLALVAAGLSRDDAYRIVQRNAMRAWEEGVDFRTLLEADPEVTLAQRSTTRSTCSGRCAHRRGVRAAGRDRR